MRLLTITFLSALFTIESSALTDWEKEWYKHPSVEEESDSSKYVLVGKVLKAQKILEPQDFILGTIYTIKVDELLKGTPAKIIEIYDENSSGRFPMEVGISYLIFAFEGVFEGMEGLHLAINHRGNSKKLNQAGMILETTRKLRKAKAQPIAPAKPSPSARGAELY
jgi:hypothetical protein